MPGAPYILSGKCYDVNGSLLTSGTVTLTHEVSSSQLSASINGLGEVMFNMADLASWTDGDFVRMTVSGAGTLTQDYRLRCVAVGTAQLTEVKVKYDV